MLLSLCKLYKFSKHNSDYTHNTSPNYAFKLMGDLQNNCRTLHIPLEAVG